MAANNFGEMKNFVAFFAVFVRHRASPLNCFFNAFLHLQNFLKNNFNGYSSYMDGNLPFDINDFKRDDNNKSSSKNETLFTLNILRIELMNLN